MARDVGYARLHTTPMRHLIAADDLDLDDGYAHLFATSPPFIASERSWIHAVGDHGLANAQVVGSHGLGNRVSLGLHDQSALPERLLD
jgi:hypothetical protein